MKEWLIASLVLLLFNFESHARPALGVSGGIDIPVTDRKVGALGAHTDLSVEVNEYALRLQYRRFGGDFYTIGGLKRFFFALDSYARPFAEVGGAITIVDMNRPSLSFGPVATVGVGMDLALSDHVSIGVNPRYEFVLYFGETDEGDVAMKHFVSVPLVLKLWF